MSEQLSLLAPSILAAKPKMPPGPILRTAEIADGCRYVLRRAWGAGPSILWHGLNPSNADAERDDPTILREIGFSFRWGFGSLVKTNFYPFITPKPAELRAWLKQPGSHEARLRNELKIRDETGKSDVRVAAWGAGISMDGVNEFMGSCFWDIEMPRWKCLGTNIDGSPIHTLARGKRRVPDSAVLVDWKFEPWEDYH
jgi:hypothetical protein